MSIDLNQSLNDLKQLIAKSSKLGNPIRKEHQRLFHMGRELKTGGRSLESLGVGKFGVFIVHVHCTVVQQSKKRSSSSRAGPSPAVAAAAADKRVVNLLDDSDDDDDDDDEVVVLDGPVQKRRR